MNFNYVSRISDNYHTSKDYSKLFDDLIKNNDINIVCFVGYCDSYRFKENSFYQPFYQKIAIARDAGLRLDVSSLGICYFTIFKEDPNSKEQFINLCQKYDLEYLEPTKEN